MHPFLLVLAVLIAPALRAADQPVPVQEEPLHKVVFENDYVRVIDVQIPRGDTSLFHIHVIPSIVVYLTQSTNRSESWPDHAILTRDVSPGQSRYAPYDKTPLTHRVTNTGAGLFRVFDIELLKKPAAAAAPAVPLPPGVKPHWDETLARSSSVQLEPNAKLEIPRSRHAYLVVAISGTPRITPEGPKAAGPKSMKPGDYQFFPPQTQLEIVNANREKAEAVLLELKG